MLFILPLIYCETSVVQIIQRNENGENTALLVDNGRTEVTENLEDLRTNFLMNKVARGPMVELSPIMQQNKKLGVDRAGAVAVVHKDRDNRKWRIKKEGHRHKLAMGRMCLAIRRGLVTAESCEEGSPRQEFMIAAHEDFEDPRYFSSLESVYEDHREIFSEDSDHVEEAVEPEHVVLEKEAVVDEDHDGLGHGHPDLVYDTRIVSVPDTEPFLADPRARKVHGQYGKGSEEYDGTRRYPPRSARPEAERKSPLRRKRRQSDAVNQEDVSPDKKASNDKESSAEDAEPKKMSWRKRDIEYLQNLICDHPNSEGESTSSEGLLGLIKKFGDDKKDSEFFEIQTPSMFGKKGKSALKGACK